MLATGRGRGAGPDADPGTGLGTGPRAERIRVVAVDDSALMRALLRGALEAEGDIAVVGLAADTAEARAMIRTLDPAVVTLDVEMPGMNGLDFLAKLMALRPTPVVMVSSLTAQGTETALEALAMGAVEALPKPAGPSEVVAWGARLRAAVRAAAMARVRPPLPPPAPPPPAAPPAPGAGSAAPPDAIPFAVAAPARHGIVAIGASTGGVAAIGRLLAGLGGDLPPVVITQHMPPGYTDRFARRLAAETGRDIAEAREGERLLPGMVRIAPGDRHLAVERAGSGLRTRLGGSEPCSGHCPSVDRLFLSVAAAAGPAAIGIILTGMGRDGAQGLLAMRRAGAHTLGEAAESCVVYGMPRAAMAAGAVGEELALDRLVRRLAELARVPAQAPGGSAAAPPPRRA
jgi:two-component system chemotaxis response regulator CheB